MPSCSDDVVVRARQPATVSALLGRNGVGKTTLLITLMGLTRVCTAGASAAVARTSTGAADVPTRAGRVRLGAAGALRVSIAHGRRAPDRGRATRATGRSSASATMLPRLHGAAGQLRQPAVRRRAADARDRASADGQPAPAAAGRADGRPGADHRAGTDARDPQPGRRRAA